MKEYLPLWLRRGVRRAFPKRRPESTFMRVAYSIPKQVVLITARHQGKENIWPMDWHFPLSFVPRLYGLALNPKGFGAELVFGSGVFVVNFVPASWEKVIFMCGDTSGRRADKFALAGLTREEAESVDAPRLAESLGALECAVRQKIEVGDHILVIGEVLHEVLRAAAPRLHHIDVRLKEVAESFELPNAT